MSKEMKQINQWINKMHKLINVNEKQDKNEWVITAQS